MQVLYRNANLPSADGKALMRRDILTEGGIIRAVEARIPPDAATEVVESGGHIVIPGLVNAHWHTMSNLLKGMYNRFPLEIWRQYVRGVWGTLLDRAMYVDCMLGCMEMAENGATAAVDHIAMFQPALAGTVGMAMRAMADSGLRGRTALMVSDEAFEKTIPVNAAGLGPEAQAAMGFINAKETAVNRGHVAEFIGRYHTGGRVDIALGPAAPQRCSKEMLLYLKGLCEQHDLPMHMHVLETRTQAVHCKEKFGMSAIAYLDSLGLLDKRLAMAHVVWAEEADIGRIARSGATVVHNPASNLKLGSGVAPVPQMLRAGVNVALGTDGACSNDGQSMFDAMRLAGLIHNIKTPDFAAWPSGRQVFHMAAQAGAAALGLPGGKIEPGCRADLVFLRKDTVSFTPLNDFYEQLVFAENGKAVDRVVVDGKPIVQDGRFTAVNRGAILAEAREIRQSLSARMERVESSVRGAEAALRAMYHRVMAAEKAE